MEEPASRMEFSIFQLFTPVVGATLVVLAVVVYIMLTVDVLHIMTV
jgi:hypothetical protein